jgi:hypothetical protein
MLNKKDNNFIYKNIRLILKNISLLILFNFLILLPQRHKIRVALCTMGKNEILYIKEFINYYIKLGMDHIFIYDDNNITSERLSKEVDKRQKLYVTIYENIKNTIFNQSDAFTNCYQNNKNNFDWILMVDMDEFLYIKKDTLKNYLLKPVFKKCDFIKFHWVHPSDNNKLHYENKSLFERFKKPYKESIFIKSIVKGNISKLKYWVHSPYESPLRNVTCNNIGRKINYINMNFEAIMKINIKKGYIIHFNYKSTEEFINKFKRGYSNWFGKKYKDFVNAKIDDYFRDNKITEEKIEYFEKELKLNLTVYRSKLNKVKF